MAGWQALRVKKSVRAEQSFGVMEAFQFNASI
jgi:hypothetical protein